jgi:cysteine-rich repeat protein
MGDYACDDGNQVSGDGCDQDCVLEDSYTCSFGTLVAGDLCSEACHAPAGGPVVATQNDGGQWSCQDNNDGDDDGCYDCEVEKGWECVEGDYNTIDNCSEVCGDGYNMADNHACDDGNVDYLGMGEDGCDWANGVFDGGCTVSGGEAGYECAGLHDEWSPSKC